MSETIPTPKGYPVIGNVLEVDPEHPYDSLNRIAASFGPIFRLKTPKERTYVSSYELAREIFDERRFQKSITGPLREIRNAAHDGLFTAFQDEHNWSLAHHLLLPAFGPLSIRGMFGEMQDILSQMVLKWARQGPEVDIDVPDDFTRLTADSIVLCAMGSRLNSFYHEPQHIFVQAMGGMLKESVTRTRRPPLPEAFFSRANERFGADINTLQSVAAGMLAERRAHPTDKKDLLNAMIYSKDKDTGEQLDDENIINNMITFLIAGHETTSGMLSFLFYELLDNAPCYRKAQKEVDDVVGKGPVTLDHLSKLPYIEACLREALRMHPPISALGLEAKGDQVLGDGKYLLKDKEVVSVLLQPIHHDPEIYGEDVAAFRPERLYGEAFEKIPRNAWKPFGNGVRGCLGRPFAWQESLLAVATLLQTFHFTPARPSYRLDVRVTATIKPRDFYMRARLRDPAFLEHAGITLSDVVPQMETAHPAHTHVDGEFAGSSPLTILYGSNTGTCEALAQALTSAASGHGFAATVKPLDSAIGALDAEVPVIIVSGSYEGQPPDNAAHFVEWLSSGDVPDLKSIRYAVYGVGNKEWVTTYQRIPTLIDDLLARHGAHRICERSAINVTEGNIFDDFDQWQDEVLWPRISKAASTPRVDELPVHVDTQTRPGILRQDVQAAEVCETRLLTKVGAPRKCHIALRLPTGLSYRAGDYLAVLPLNPPGSVERVLRRFALPWDASISIDASAATFLPKSTSLSVHDVLSGMVELGQPATKRAVLSVIKSIPNKDEASKLEQWAAGPGIDKMSISLLDLLERYPSAALTLGQFLALLTPMRMRQYSISSTPLEGPSICSLTYSVIDAPSRGGAKGSRFLGVCSSYLERLKAGDRLLVSLRPSRTGFHLPDKDSTPIVMACAGTGLAPFHAFVAERAFKKANGIAVGPALLFYGCNRPEEDDMYREEFDKWESQDIVDVRRAYTLQPEASAGCKFVQDRIWHDRKDALKFFRGGARIYICGAGAVGSGIEKAMVRIRMESQSEDEAAATRWLRSVKGERYWADVFA